MKTRSGEIRLGVFVLHAGYHLAGWRHPDALSGGENFPLMRGAAQTAEKGKFDLFFLPDTLTSSATATPSVATRLEPLTLLSALSQVTTHIGLAATATTTYSEPYNLARQLASLDHISAGRAAWNVVTTLSDDVSANFGKSSHLELQERYAQAQEFVDIVKGLWDSWEETAFVRNKEAGAYFRKDQVHPLNHKGNYFSVRGPLNIGRPPQGHPLIIVAGASVPGQSLGARIADIVFSAQHDIEEAKYFYCRIKNLAKAAGRDPKQLYVFPGVMPIIGKTAADAEQKYAYLQELIDIEHALPLLSFFIGFDASKYPLDIEVPDPPEPHLMEKSRTRLLIDFARSRKLTIRELAKHVAAGRGHLLVVGTAAQVADKIVDWYEQFAADGFNIMPPYLPGGLDDFVQGVVPILQERKLFKKDYAGRDLRDRLGLKRPEPRLDSC